VELVITQLDGFLDVPITKSPLYGPVERDPDPAFRLSWEKLIADTINPAIRNYRDFLATTYLPKARTVIGVSANLNGAACYAASLRAQTSLDISPRELFEAGQRAVATGRPRRSPLRRSATGSRISASCATSSRKIPPTISPRAMK
jgi:uncharacterized protein (DUF885 family)